MSGSLGTAPRLFSPACWHCTSYAFRRSSQINLTTDSKSIILTKFDLLPQNPGKNYTVMIMGCLACMYSKLNALSTSEKDNCSLLVTLFLLLYQLFWNSIWLLNLNIQLLVCGGFSVKAYPWFEIWLNWNEEVSCHTNGHKCTDMCIGWVQRFEEAQKVTGSA